MTEQLQITAQRKVLREIAVLVQAAHLGQQDPNTQRAVFASHAHMLHDQHRRHEVLRASLSSQDHAAALRVAEQHGHRFHLARMSLMNASPITV